RMLVPRVRAFFLEPLHHVAQRSVILQTFPASVAVKHDDGHAPETLPRDAPVRALLNHLVHAVFTPGGNPLYLVNFFERFLAQRSLASLSGLVHFDEPLLRGAANHRIVAAPGGWRGVPVIGLPKQRAAILEERHDNRVRAEHRLAPVFWQPFGLRTLV